MRAAAELGFELERGRRPKHPSHQITVTDQGTFEQARATTPNASSLRPARKVTSLS